MIILDSVSSTNEYIKENVEKLKDIDVVVARIQTKGKGRVSKNWDSSISGNLYASIFLKDISFLTTPLHLSIIIAVCIKRTVFSITGKNPGIKWPNDIYVEDAKLAGVLIENVKEGAIVGIGLNIVKAPKLIDKKTISLKDISDLNIIPEDFMRIFLDIYKDIINTYQLIGFQNIAKEWEKHCIHMNKYIEIPKGILDNPKNEGLFLGINHDGAAKVLIDKTQHLIYCGEINFARSLLP